MTWKLVYNHSAARQQIAANRFVEVAEFDYADDEDPYFIENLAEGGFKVIDPIPFDPATADPALYDYEAIVAATEVVFRNGGSYTPPPPPPWRPDYEELVAVVDALRTAPGDPQLALHIANSTPHPAYDDDIQSLVGLFEAALI